MQRKLFTLFFALLPSQWAAKLAAWLFLRTFPVPAPTWELELGGHITRLAGCAVTIWGTGPTVLLVHGWNGRGTQLGKLVNPLVNAGFRVVAVDGPGHGRTGGRSTTMPEFARALMAVAKELGEIHAMVGHSFGGASCLLAASLGLKVNKVVVIGSPSRIERVFENFSTYWRLSKKTHRSFCRLVEKKTNISLNGLNTSQWVQGLEGLIIHSSGDEVVPFEEARFLADRWPGARLMAVEAKLGHFRLLKDSGVIKGIQDFL